MEELLGMEQNLRLNPYITQAEKLANSLQQLAYIFVTPKERGEITKESAMKEIETFAREIQKDVCVNCKNVQDCKTKNYEEMQVMVQEIIEEIDEYGLELSIRNKRALSKRCLEFETLIHKVEKHFWDVKYQYLWEERMEQSRHASFIIMRALLKTLEMNTKEIDASIFRDDRLERRISKALKRMGVRTLKILLLVSEEGIFEVHISGKAKGKHNISTMQIAESISRALGRRLQPEQKEGFVLKQEYQTMVFVEQMKYQTLCGVAKKTKYESSCSGDNFLLLDQGGGKKSVLISDGMGSGQGAYNQSQFVLEMSEVLLEAGVSPRETVEMVNALLVADTGEVEFATFDMGIVDTYNGTLELIKAGAAATYVITDEMTQCYEASSLPIGVVADIEMNQFQIPIHKNCFVIMMTDGTLEAIPEEEREIFIRKTMREIKTKNPTEIAERIIEKALEMQEGIARDDMTVLILGVWELQF